MTISSLRRLWNQGTGIAIGLWLGVCSVGASPPQPPTITSQPQSQSVVAGTNASFSVTVTGTTPFTYHWSFNGTNLSNGSHIGGATTSILTISNVALTDAGNYRVAITNSRGFAISSNAVLTVGQPPGITLQPTNQTLLAGSNLTLRAGASGVPPPALQWFHDGAPLADDGRVSGSTNATLVVTNLQLSDHGNYWLVASNSFGAVTSAVAAVYVVGFVDVAAGLPNAYYGDVRWVDYDNDGYLDLFLSGYDANYWPHTWLFHNNHDGTFTEVATPFPNWADTSADWADFDNDGYLDLVIKGSNDPWNGNSAAQVFRNLGGTNFVFVTSLPAYYNGGSITWADFDNDGKPDVLLSTGNFTLLCRNNGDGTFTNIYQLPGGTSSVADYDNDGWLDILLSGSYPLGTKLYHNTGTNTFTDSGWGLVGFYNDSSAWGDYNNDGWADLLLSGRSDSSEGTNLLFKNSVGTLTYIPASFALFRDGAVAWGDFDNDGNLDFFSFGLVLGVGYQSTLYHNSGAGGGFFDSGFTMPGVSTGAAAWGDYDNDGALDLIYMGGNSGGMVTKLYHNVGAMPDHPPSTPTGLTVTRGRNSALLSWTASTDPDQSGGLTYNVRIGSSNGAVNVLSPLSDLATGFRRVPKTGNAGYRTSLLITNLPAGTYYWSVQAIDNAFQGSPFATEQSLDLPAPVITNQPQGLTVFADVDVRFEVGATGASPLVYQWTFNGTNLTGATGATLVLTNVQTADSGIYNVVVSNAFGMLTSSNAVLVVNTPPRILAQPQDVSAAEGADVSFTVVASGDPPLAYQWLFNGVPIAGATNAVLSLPSVVPSQAGGYSVQVTNLSGVTNSIAAALSIPPSVPIILAQPQSLFVPAGMGADAVFSVRAIGTTPVSYQWRFKGAELPGATNSGLMVTNVQTGDAGAYSVLITNSVGPTLSQDAMLSITPAAASTTNFISFSGAADFIYDDLRDILYIVNGGSNVQRYQLGSSSFLTPFSISGSLANLDLSPDGNLLAIADQTSGTNAQLYLVDLNSSTVRQVILTNFPGYVYSLAFGNDGAVVCEVGDLVLRYEPLTGVATRRNTVLTSSGPMTASADRSTIGILGLGAFYGYAGLIFTYNVTNQGIDGFVMSVDYISAPPEVSRDGAFIAGPTSYSLLVATNPHTRDYSGYFVASPPSPSGAVFSPNQDLLFCGRSGTRELRGYETTNFTESFVLDFGAAITSSRMRTSRDGSKLFGAVSGGINWLTWTNTAPSFASQPVSQTAFAGSNVTFSARVFGSPPMRFQWRRNGVSLPGATSTTLVLSNVAFPSQANYSVIAYNPCGVVTSTNATLTVLSPPFITAQPQSQSIGAGSNALFAVTADGPAPLVYQWLAEGTNIAGATASSLALTNVQATTAAEYAVVVTNLYGSVTSVTATLTVIPNAPFFVVQPQSQTVPAATNVSFTGAAMGTEPIGYQWQFKGADLPGKTSTVLTIANVQDANAGDYTVVASNSAGITVSAPATLAVTPVAPIITLQPVSRTATKGAEVVFTTAASGSEPFAFQWWFNTAPLDNATSAALVLTNVQPSQAGNYSLVVTNSSGAATSSVATLTITAPPGYLWTRVGGGASTDEGKCVAVDPWKNIYVAGTFSSTAAFGTNVVTSAGSSDIFVAKYDPAGQLLWIRQAGGAGLDTATAIAPDASGNVFVTGYIGANATFGAMTLTNLGGNDVFVAKYSGAGDLLWATNAGGAGADVAWSAAADNSGGVFVAGYFSSTASFGANSLTTAGGPDVFLARYDANGQCLWAQRAGGPGPDEARSVAVDAAGNAALVGSFFGTASFGGSNLVSAGGTDIFVSKWTAAGSLVWATRAGGPGTDSLENARGVAFDCDGNLLVTGAHGNNATFGNFIFTTAGPNGAVAPDAFLAKYSRDGAVLWVARGAGPYFDFGYAVASDAAGNAFVAGIFGSQGPTGGTISFGGTNQLTGSGVFLAMFNAAGEAVWARKITSNSYDFGPVLAQDDLGNVFITGGFSLTGTFGHNTFTSAGSLDVFLSKWSAFDPAAPPVFTSTLSNRTVVAGANVMLSAGVNSIGPAACQWQLNGVDLSGATNFTLILSNVLGSASGDYRAIVSNPYGSATSAVATVTVNVEPGFVWAKHFGGPGNDECLAVAADASGNSYAAGYFSGTADFGGTNLASNGGEDIFLAKFDGAQNLLWLRQIGGANDDRATALALDDGGNVVVAGYFTGAPDFGGTNLVSAGTNDIFLAKYDPDGNLLWAQQAGGAGSDAARGVAVYTNGDIAIAGSFQWNAVFGNVTLINRNNGINDIFVARYTGDGQLLWAKSAGGTSADQARGVAFDRVGNVFVTGSFAVSATFDNVTLSSGRKSLEIFIAKYDPNGYILWARTPGSAVNDTAVFPYDDEGAAVAADDAGNVFFAGYFQALGAFASNYVASVSSNAPDLFLTKYDPTGNALWVRTAGGVAADAGNALSTDAAGNVFVAGSFIGPARFGSSLVAGIGGGDAFVAMYDTTGNLVKVRQAGGADNDSAQALALDGRGNVVAGGYHTGPAVFGANPIGAAGARDAFLTKVLFFNPDAAPLITTGPQNQTVPFNGTVNLEVGVTSGSALGYQWLFNGNPLADRTQASLRLQGFQYGNVGEYAVVVTNAFGALTSATASVTVELTPEFVWLNKAGGTGDDQALALAMDSATNLYVAGYFTGTANFTNPVAQTNLSLVSAGGADAFLAKYNAAGHLLWARRAGGSGTDSAQAATLDAAGNILVAGAFNGTATFGTASLVSTGLADIFIAKYDGAGNALWARSFGGYYMDQANGITTDGAGDIYLAGSFGRSLNLGGLVLTNSSDNISNFFVARFDASGNVLWARTAPATGSSSGIGIALDSATNVFVTGNFLGSINFGTGVMTNPVPSYQGGMVFVAKYDPNGGFQWVRTGSGSGVGIGQGLAVDAQGNIFAVATKISYGTSFFLTKYDSVGNVLWNRWAVLSCCTLGTLGACGLALDAEGNPTITGGVYESATVEGLSFSSQGFVARYSSQGQLKWILKSGQWANRVALDRGGNAYLAGRFFGQGLFGITNILTAFGGNDAFLVKLGVRPPTAATDTAVKTIAADSDTTLRAAPAGTGPFAYQWRLNGTNIADATRSSLQLSHAQWTNAGLYSVVVMNAVGSSISAPAVVNVAPRLYAQLAGGDLRLSWNGAFTLQSASNATGPFHDLAGVASPYLYDTEAGPYQFFRLKANPFGLSASRQPDGSLLLRGDGISGYNFYLLTSTNLVNWSPVSTNFSPITFTDPAAKTYPQRFYRAVLAQ